MPVTFSGHYRLTWRPLWQERVGTIRKGNVTWCVLSPLPVAWAGICVWCVGRGAPAVSVCICRGSSSPASSSSWHLKLARPALVYTWNAQATHACESKLSVSQRRTLKHWPACWTEPRCTPLLLWEWEYECMIYVCVSFIAPLPAFGNALLFLLIVSLGSEEVHNAAIWLHFLILIYLTRVFIKCQEIRITEKYL